MFETILRIKPCKMNKGIFLSAKLYITSLIILLLIPSCSVNPVTGKKEIILMSEAQEIAMGKTYDPQVVASFGLYEDEKMQQFINEKGKEMGAISHRPQLNYEFKILDSPVVNAFAVPGGYVYFTRGIMAHFNNEAEFAGVLGHEIGHVTARHSAKQQSTQTLAQLGLIVGVIASKEIARYAGQAQQALGLLFLKFGRDDESESDQLGVQYSTKIGYDAHEMAKFFSTLKRMRGGSEAEQIPTFMSTHPDPADRELKVEQAATKWQAGRPRSEFKINRDQYLRMIDGLVYGEDPRQGYVDDNKFFHPELKFEFPIPSGWKSMNSPQQFQMAPDGGKAMMVLKLAEGQDLEAAASKFLTDNKLQILTKQNKKINGLNAIITIADQPAEVDQNGKKTEALRFQTYFILYNDLIYQLMGLTRLADFETYKGNFNHTMNNFKRLTNPNRINVKPDRILIKTVNKTGSLKNTLLYFKMPADRLEEIALINGMQLSDTVKQGSLIKIVKK
jgi:predicted Zn-dependent protease